MVNITLEMMMENFFQESTVPHDFFFSFSKKSQEEVAAYIRGLQSMENLDAITPKPSELPFFASEVEFCRRELEDGGNFLLLGPMQNLNVPFTLSEQRLVTWLMSQMFGEPLVQNDLGERRICVFDRDRSKSMKQGARYHQTREGGTIHTDNVNLPDPWEYMLLACVSPAGIGGESILVKAQQVHDSLKEFFPEVLKTLKEPFIWECRGIADATYEAPIITFDSQGRALFRYLRPYLESAHLKKGVPLTSDQLYALDTLDAILESSSFQTRFFFKQGQILLTFDARVLHGRTCFSDPLNAISILDQKYNAHEKISLKRTMDRIWVRKRKS